MLHSIIFAPPHYLTAYTTLLCPKVSEVYIVNSRQSQCQVFSINLEIRKKKSIYMRCKRKKYPPRVCSLFFFYVSVSRFERHPKYSTFSMHDLQLAPIVLVRKYQIITTYKCNVFFIAKKILKNKKIV